MKKYLVFIDSSEGELDWISPFVKYESKKGAEFYFYLDRLGRDYEEKSSILKKYGFDSSNLINGDEIFDPFDIFIYKVVNKLSYIYSGRSKLSRIFPTDKKRNDFFHFLLRPYFFLKKPNQSNEKEVFDGIFRDYNMTSSLALSYYLNINKKANVIVYPHAVGIQPKNENRVPPFKIKCDLWLENTKRSLHAKEVYEKEFFVSGPPALSNAIDNPLFDSESKNVLVLTRNWMEQYGYNFEDALVLFDKLLENLSHLGFKAIIKHHPRDESLERWRDIQSKYDHIEEFKGSLSDFDISLRVCLTLFSTAGIYVLAKGVPVIDFSPYKKLSEFNVTLPFHFASKDTEVVTHELPSLGIYKQEQNLEEIVNIVSDGLKLAHMSASQQKILYSNFPSRANQVISSKLKEIRNR
ncbi:hypothetical protein NJD71_00345 [Psychrobacter sp. PP-21]|uniref:hypothetical protein n=1 Tax=Psychrobacter sp. PP-21 TaxID=2957503 RepID=UPI0029BFA027|nr:hypothetical protein [Psychrobacter sp. PP-21]MDX2372573.1 hypothetical protein [Psychrobacter sp. PP-21]